MASMSHSVETVVLLDPRWPLMMPLEWHGKLCGTLDFTEEVSIATRWQLLDVIAPGDATILISTVPQAPQVRQALAAGAKLYQVPSLEDPAAQAQWAVAQALERGEWERKQTHESLLPYLEGEAAEFIAAVREGHDSTQLCAELGDILLNVIFHAEIASREGNFLLADVYRSLVAKLQRRAPFLFDGSTGIVPEDEQIRLWELGKSAE